MLGLPRTFTLGLLAIISASAILAVRLGDAYGEFWGGLAGTFAAPLICTLLVRARMNKRSRQ
jgi:hypothetical protein